MWNKRGGSRLVMLVDGVNVAFKEVKEHGEQVCSIRWLGGIWRSKKVADG